MKFRFCLVVLIPCMLIAGGTPPADRVSKDSSSADPNAKDGTYVSHTFNLRAVGMAAMGSAVNQANDTPHEWGQGLAGFGRRFASAFSKHIVHKSIQYPISRMLHEELSYHPSGKTKFGPRLESALLGSFIRHKTTTGKSTLAVGEISGAIGSGLISRLWQPATTGSLATGFASGGITLGVDTGMNVVKEFWPEIRHPRQHARKQQPAPQPVETTAELTSSPEQDAVETEQ